MEETTFKKDETPYLVFACRKCQQFAYVKTTQKTKKCLRCGRAHLVSSLTEGEMVYGMTAAVDVVKRKQTELAIPEFRSGSDFVISSSSRNKRPLPIAKENILTQEKRSKDEKEVDYSDKFEQLLNNLSRHHKCFPKYMIEIISEDYGIPLEEVKGLINIFKKRGILLLVKHKEFYYELNLS